MVANMKYVASWVVANYRRTALFVRISMSVVVQQRIASNVKNVHIKHLNVPTATMSLQTDAAAISAAIRQNVISKKFDVVQV